MKRPALLCAFLTAVLGGCAARNQRVLQASNSSASSLSKIKHLEGVPDAVQSPLGLTLPKGFKLSVLSSDLAGPRRMAFAPGATPRKFDLFVAEPSANRISILRVGNGQVLSKSVYATGLNQPYGLAFGNKSLYVGNTDAIVRFPYATGQLQATASPQKIADLTEGGYNQHWTRNLLFAPDAKHLFVTVGSSCNTCEESDPQRAAISILAPDGSKKNVYASGLRNPVGLALQPGTNQLWAIVNERDNLGDDEPPDYLTRIKQGAFYGWPYAYTDIGGQIHPDPNFGDAAPQRVRQTVAPDVPVQAHSAALGVAFYPLRGGKFPATYKGDAFLTYHGSWNRSAKTGYKVVRVDFQNGEPKTISDFVTGFLNENGKVWGRPVDVQVAPDGSVLFSDDSGGKIWRVAYGDKTK